MRLSAAATYLVTTSIGSTLLAGSYCEGRTSLFQSNFAAFGVSKSSSKQQQALSSSLALNLRGGGESDEDITSEKDDVVTELYLPGLLEAEVSLRTGQSTVSEDSTVSISSKKARELGLKAGDIVKIIGRRRRFSFCTIKVLKGVNGCRLGRVLAGNLRIRSGDKLKIVPLDSEDDKSIEPELASSVTFSPIKDSLVNLEAIENDGDEFSDDELYERFIVPYLEGEKGLLKAEHVVRIVDANGKALDFVVSHVSFGDEEGEADGDPCFQISGEDSEVVVGASQERLEIGEGYDGVGGCGKAVSLMRELVELPLRFPELWTSAGVPTPKGVLLHGPPGCGKTLLANAMVEETGAHIVSINGPEIMARKGGESEANLRQAFEEAIKHAPSIIFMDELDSIAPKRDSAQGETEKRIVSQLLTLMDTLKPSSNVMVIGATNRPNVIESALRRPGRFDRELEIPIPDEEGRFEILQICTKDMELNDEVDLLQISRDTHGYVGADLRQLCLEAALQCIRNNIEHLDVEKEAPLSEEELEVLVVNNEHFNHALQHTDPSTLRDNKVEVPDVKWVDIGGLEDTKRELQEMVRYPIEHRHLFEKFGMMASRGVLFYGPPGCGKTLMAKAIANECGANFISVKGPELLNAWFGGSEANVRDLFDKARAASPCILFFDEMDSIARARGGGGGGASETSDRVINQLLAEIDGVGSGKTLFIIGATNRPDILDPGLMRPGRLDQLIYIPLPDHASRVSIFKANLRKSPVADDITFEQLADVTDGFSGADITEICQRAAKNAIRDSITAEIERQKRVEDGELSQEEADALPDSVPCITRAHFEASMSKARRSVTPDIVAQYDEFQAKSKEQWETNAEEGASLYDFDAAAAEQAREDALMEGLSEEGDIPAGDDSD